MRLRRYVIVKRCDARTRRAVFPRSSFRRVDHPRSVVERFGSDRCSDRGTESVEKKRIPIRVHVREKGGSKEEAEGTMSRRERERAAAVLELLVST